MTDLITSAAFGLRQAITGLSARTEPARIRYQMAFAAYEKACWQGSVCGNLGCDEPIDRGLGAFCTAHRVAARTPSCAGSRSLVSPLGCEGPADAVQMSSLFGDRPKACVAHAAALLINDPVWWRAEGGTVLFADTEAYARAGLRRGEE